MLIFANYYEIFLNILKLRGLIHFFVFAFFTEVGCFFTVFMFLFLLTGLVVLLLGLFVFDPHPDEEGDEEGLEAGDF